VDDVVKRRHALADAELRDEPRDLPPGHPEIAHLAVVGRDDHSSHDRRALRVEASLSFLGLGIRPPEPSLGSLLDASRNVMRYAPWYPLLPGLVLVLLLYALNGAADVLNDLLNPRQR